MFATHTRLAVATGAVADQSGQSTAEVFVAFGRVEPGDERWTAVMQRKLKGEKRWSTWTHIDADRQRRYYLERIAALDRPGIVWYRVKVPGNETFKTSYSRTIDGKSSSRVCIRTS